jgi:2'-5' RNA ligase
LPSALLRTIAAVAALAIGFMPPAGYAQNSPAVQPAVTAIDIALDPDSTMTQRAKALNARLVKSYPAGFSFDATHHPHVTLVQRYVRTEDLPKIYAAVAALAAQAHASGLGLTADKYVFSATPPTGARSMLIGLIPSPDVPDLQQKIAMAVAPYTTDSGTAAAFYTTPADPNVAQSTIDYVTTFVPKASGANFMPHVTLGLGVLDTLTAIAAEPLQSFTFTPVSLTVYQLGNYGTARLKLRGWPLAP